MMLRRGATIISLAALLSCFHAFGEGKGSGWAKWKSAYEEYAKAEELYLNNHPEEALKTFKQAYGQFKSLRDDYPKWNPKLLKFRLDLCRRRIDAVEEKLSRKASSAGTDETSAASPSSPAAVSPQGSPRLEASTPDSPRPLASSITATVAAMEKELNEYKRRYRDSLAQVKELRVQAERGQKALAQIENLLKVNNDLKDKYALVLLENEKLREKPKTDKQSEEWKRRFESEKMNTEALRIELQKLVDDNTKLLEAKTSIEKDRSKSELALKSEQSRSVELEGEIVGLKKQLAENGDGLKPKLAELEKTKKDLAAKLESKAEELEELRKKFDELAENKIDDEALNAIRQENTRLQADLRTAQESLAKAKKDQGELAAGDEEAKAQIEKLNTILASLNANQENLEKELYFYKSKFAQSQTLDRNQKQRIVTLTNKNKELSDEIKELGEGYETLRGKVNGADEALKELTKLKGDVQDLRAQNAALEEIRKKLELEAGATTKDLEATSERADAAEANVKTIQNELNETKKKLADLKRDDQGATIQKLRTDLETANAELTKRTEANAAMDETVKKLQTDLEKTKAELATKTAEDKKVADETVKKLRTELEAAKTDAENRLREKASSDEKIQKLENDLKLARATLETSRKQDADAAVELNKLRGQFESDQKRMAALEKSNQDLAKKNAELDRELDSVKSEEDRKIKEYLGMIDDLDANLKKNQNELKTLLNTFDEEKTRLVAEINAKDDVIKKLRKSIPDSDENKAEMTELRQRLEKTEKALKTARKIHAQKIEELEGTITSQKSEILELKNASPEMLVSTRILNESDQNLDMEFKDQMDRDVIAFLLSSAERSKQEGNIDSVIWHYKKIISISPNNIEVLKRLAEIYSERGDDNNALLYYEKAFRNSPDDIDILAPLGALYVEHRNHRLALAILNRSLDVAPNVAETHRLLGDVYAKLGWPQAAEAEMREAKRLDPKDPAAAFSLSELLATTKPERLDEARKLYEKAKGLGAKPDEKLEKLLNQKESKK